MRCSLLGSECVSVRSDSLDTFGIVVHLLVRGLLLGEQLAPRLVGQVIDLLAEEGLNSTVNARGQPQDDVDKVNPDSRLHGRGAASLVGLVALPVEEDTSKDAKDDDPGDEEGGVPGEGAVGLCDLDPAPNDGDRTDRCRNDEEHGGDGRQAGDEDGEDPLGGEAVVGLAVGVDAVAVEAAGDDGEEELQAAADEAGDHLEGLEPGLADLLAGVGALVEGVAARLTAELALVGVAEVLGGAGEALGRLAELDGLESDVEFTHFGGGSCCLCE